MIHAAAPTMPGFSFAVLFTLMAVVVASYLVFWILSRRATTMKRWLELAYWAADNKLRLQGPERAKIPKPLDQFTDMPAEPLLLLANRKTSLAQLRTPGPRTAPNTPARWNVLVRQIRTAWPPTGLRPVHNATSLLDLLSLGSFPSLLPPERFVAFGIDSSTARQLARTSVAALLPADIGFLLHGRSLILDFSDRPFDTLELSRMVALADQLATRLPGEAPPAK